MPLPRTGVGALTELEVSLCLTANQVQLYLLAVRAQPLNQRFGTTQDSGGVRTCQTAVTGNNQDCGATVFVGSELVRLVNQRVLNTVLSRNRSHHAGQSVRVRAGCLSSVTSLVNAGGRDHLHRLEDLLHRRRRSNLLSVNPNLGSHRASFLLAFCPAPAS